MKPSNVEQALNRNATVYVSLTGLKTKGLWNAIRFWRHAVPSFNQSKKSPGILYVKPKTVNGIHYTLSVWESKKAMLAFVHSAAHAKAVKIFSEIATGRTFGYESTRVPTWNEIPKLLESEGRYYRPRKAKSW